MFDIILSSPGRVFMSIGSFEIYTYGVLMAVAVLLGVLISNSLANNSKIFLKDIFIELSPILIVFGFLGARLWYCSLNLQAYLLSPLNILNFRDGGLSIHGAILGGLCALLIYAKRKKTSLLRLCDYSTVGLALGQSIGRWGNFFNNEAFGYPTDTFVKLFIPYESRPQNFLENSYFHPTFLYESLADFCLFILLYYLISKKNLNSGVLTLLYLLVYSFIRYFIELLRVDSNFFILGLPFPAFVSIFLFVFSLLCLVVRVTKLHN